MTLLKQHKLNYCTQLLINTDEYYPLFIQKFSFCLLKEIMNSFLPVCLCNHTPFVTHRLYIWTNNMSL